MLQKTKLKLEHLQYPVYGLWKKETPSFPRGGRWLKLEGLMAFARYCLILINFFVQPSVKIAGTFKRK